MSDVSRIFELQLQRMYLQSLRLAACAREPFEPPAWVTEQLGDVERALDVAGRSPAMAVLADRAGLDGAAEGLLWTLATASIEPRAHSHLVAALGSEVRRGLSLGAYAALGALDEAGSLRLLALLDVEHPLFRHRLLEPAADRLDAATPLTVPRRVIDHLAGRDIMDPLLAAGYPPMRARLDERQRDVLDRLREALSVQRQAMIVLEGPRGAGRVSAVAIAASELGRDVIVLDATQVPSTPADRQRALAALHREVLLRTDAVPLIANVDLWTSATDDGWQRAVLRFARAQPGTTVLTSSSRSVDLSGDEPVVRLHWDVGDHATRHALWRDALAGELADRDHEVGQLAHRYKLGPGGIERAVHSAHVIAAHGNERAALRMQDLVLGVRSNITERMRSLARRIDVVESWDDLVLSSDAQDAIRGLINRIKFAHRVYEEWGFKRRASRGTGVAALFSGPPGTGKTMVAGLIARELELELYQIDLSQVVSKWVGETEKHLGQLFDAAEAGHALLLFDEADALFAKRSTDVKGAQDRYANLEVNYLLQRIEAFSGIAILTTNLDASIDNALKRRLAAHVVFYPPDDDERAMLWERMARSGGAPIDCTQRDFAQLSREFPDMSGAHIRNAVLAAAFIAASEGGPISKPRLARAAQLEYRSMGRVLATRL
jgi:AAA+ superfamily predicted ATPase